MRSKDLICIHGASLIIYGIVNPSGLGLTAEDISSKLSVFYPAIGTTQASLSMDFMRLVAGIWVGSPAATAGDGFMNFSTNSNTRMQLVKTGFTPPANQTNYHLAYYSATTAPVSPTQIDIGTTAGSGMILAMQSAGGTQGNLYNTTSAFVPTLDVGGAPLPIATNVFVISRIISTQEHFYYAIDSNGVFQPDEFVSSPVTSNTASYAPGQLQIGNNTGGPGGVYSTKNCEGMSAGSGLTKNQSILLISAFYYIFINK